ncbi:MAG: hypothetical protein WAO91_06880 [Candidatus Nitrosotenuis sp.]
MKCRNCGKAFVNRASNYCSTGCALEYMDRHKQEDDDLSIR